MIKPYVGVTGVSSIKEVKAVRKEFENADYFMLGSTLSHKPMLGFLVSYKTLNGMKTNNKRYPKFNKLIRMLEHSRTLYPMIHYNSREPDTLANQIETLFEEIYDRGLSRALQLNIPYPNLTEIEKIKHKMPCLEIVFQASKKVLENKTPKEVAESIRPYQNLVDYLLIDPSGGKGEEFDLENSLNIYNEVKEVMPDLTLGFAGGFNKENVKERIKSLIERVKSTEFCIDAEGGLRDKIDLEYGNDLLNINKVREYLIKSHEVLP